MKISRTSLPVAALVAASLTAFPGSALADPAPSPDSVEQAQPETIDNVLATLDRMPTDQERRSETKAALAERLVQAVVETSNAERQTLLDRILNRLDGWNADEGVGLADDFLTRLARSIRDRGYPVDASVLFSLKLDRMMARPIGSSLDDFYATVEEARVLVKNNAAQTDALVTKAVKYITSNEYGSAAQNQRIASIAVASHGEDKEAVARRKTRLVADALRRLGEALFNDNQISQARTVLHKEYVMRTYDLGFGAMADDDLAALVDSCRRMAEVWKNSSVKSATVDYVRDRVTWSEKLAQRRPADPEAQIQYGWALRDLARRGNLLDQAVSLQKLGPLVAQLLERYGGVPAVSRLAVAYYDDSGNNAADSTLELNEHRRALTIAQAAQQRFGDEAQMLEPITVIAMNIADAFKRSGRDDEMLRYYRIAREASDVDIEKNPDDPDTINRRLKLLAHEASLADERGDPRRAFEAAEARFQLALALGKRGYMVDKVLPQAEQHRNALRAKFDTIIRARAEQHLRLSPTATAKPVLPLPHAAPVPSNYSRAADRRGAYSLPSAPENGGSSRALCTISNSMIQ